MRDKRNYIILALLAVVLVMTVGFAAFSTSLQINGTANISTNWCVGFDNTKTTTYEITKGKSTGTNPTATMGYDGLLFLGNKIADQLENPGFNKKLAKHVKLPYKDSWYEEDAFKYITKGEN